MNNAPKLDDGDKFLPSWKGNDIKVTRTNCFMRRKLSRCCVRTNETVLCLFSVMDMDAASDAPGSELQQLLQEKMGKQA